MSFPTYERYKDAGVEWLGEVPEHWPVKKLKHVADVRLSNVDKHTVEGQPGVFLCNYLNVYRNDRITGAEDFMRATATPDQIVSLSLKAGDCIITKDSEDPADIGVPASVSDDLDGVVCGYHLALIRPDPVRANGRFLCYLFRSNSARSTMNVAARGLTRYALGKYAIDNLRFALPPNHEQTDIVTFLDRETTKIDCLVDEQKHLIELLKEERQAVISHAVTKGLDANAPMKDSGVEWLGQVPENWGVVPLMRLTAPGRPIMYGIVLPGPNMNTGVPVVKGGDVRPNRLRKELLCRTTVEIEAPYARARLRPYDIVYSIRGSIGDAELVPDELTDANITQDVARVSPRQEVNCRWLLYALKSKPIYVQLEQRSLGAAVRGINIFDLKRARVPAPPRAEQDQIANFLDSECRRCDQLIAEAQTATKLLLERRSALISAAVSGKIDVRDCSFHLTHRLAPSRRGLSSLPGSGNQAAEVS